VPVRYVGEIVRVVETASHIELYHDGAHPIARHAKVPRHSVAMDPAHYQGLLRTSHGSREPRPPRFDPSFLAMGGDVLVRDLATYATAAGQGAPQ
jgi:hypothetical protein